MHLYIHLKIRAAFGPGRMVEIALALFMVFMIVSPVLVRIAEGNDREYVAIILAYIGYTWMGAVLIFFSAGICMDAIRLLTYGMAKRIHTILPLLAAAHRIQFVACAVAAIFVVVYGFFEARHIRAEYLVLESKKIPVETGRMRIVQISDVHLGLIVGERRLERIIEVINQARPDVLVSTGDLFDGQPDRVDLLAQRLYDVHAPLGKFAVMGNHEVYLDRTFGLKKSAELTDRAGFVLLRNRVASVGDIVDVAGVDDEAGRGWRYGDNAKEETLCAFVNKSRFTVLLKHRPALYTGNQCTYDLQLSGHTHKGQISPFFLVTRFFFPYYSGLHEFSGPRYLYVSRGSGTWGPPIRFLAPPEVTIIDIVHKAD